MLIARRIAPGRVEVIKMTPEETSRNRAYKFRKRMIRNETTWAGFWLFTFPAEAMDGRDRREMHRTAMDSWRKFRARMWEAGTPFKFCLVVEWTKAGRPHFHVLIDRWIDKQDAEAAWVAVGGGQFLKARKIRGGHAGYKQAINYICKYLTKAVERVPGCRRWAYTHRLLEVVKKKVSEWCRITHRDLLTLNLDNDVLIENKRGAWDLWPRGYVERPI